MRARADAWKRPWGPGGLALDGRSAQDSPPPRKSPSRLRTRDAVDGRPRAVYRKFGLSRVRLRETAHRGELPGVRNASW